MPATREQIGKILASSEFNDGEKAVVKAQFPEITQVGAFESALWILFCLADDANLARLCYAFPVEGTGFKSWRGGDLGTRLRKAGLDT